MQHRRWLMVLVFIVMLVALAVAPAPAFTQEGHEWVTRYAFHQLIHDAGQYDLRVNAEADMAKKAELKTKAEAIWEAINFYDGHMNLLARAVQDPDDLGKMTKFKPNTIPLFHGWDPNTDRGWANCKGARWLADQYWLKMRTASQRALSENEVFAKHRAEEEAIGHLGVVLHLVEDMSIPHHVSTANDKAIVGRGVKVNYKDGHDLYEKDIPLWFSSYVLKYSAVYGFGDDAEVKEDPTDLSVWFHYMASQSLSEYTNVGSMNPQVQKEQQAKNYERTAKKLVPAAIACTAGVMYHAYWVMQCKPAPYISHIEYSPPPKKE